MYYKELYTTRPGGELPQLVIAENENMQSRFVVQKVLELREEGIPLEEMAVLYRAHFQAMELQMELTHRGIPFNITSGLRFFESAHIKDVIAHLKLLWNPDDELSFRRTVKLHDGIGNATADALWKSFKGELAAGLPPHKAVRALDKLGFGSTREH